MYIKFLNAWPHLTNSFDGDYSSICLFGISTWISNLACPPPACSPALPCLRSGNSILFVDQVRNLGVVLQATFFLLSHSKSCQLYFQNVFVTQPLLTTSSYPLTQAIPDLDYIDLAS